MKFLAGDRVYFAKASGEESGFGKVRLDFGDNSFNVIADNAVYGLSGSKYIDLERGDLLVHEAVYNSPLYKALN